MRRARSRFRAARIDRSGCGAFAGGAQLAELPGPIGDTHLVAITDALVVAGSNGGTVLAWPRHGETIDAAGIACSWCSTSAR